MNELELQRSWRVSWRTATLTLRLNDGKPRFALSWIPDEPHLRGRSLAEYTGGYRWAKTSLLAQLASLQRST